MLTDVAPAKVNLSLAVPGRFADGYHAVDSVVVFAHPLPAHPLPERTAGFYDAADVLMVDPDKPVSLSITGADTETLPADDDNLVLQAVRAFSDAYPDSRLGAFALQKNLPVAAGIGGGSSDAAAALRLLASLNNLTDLHRLRMIAKPLGADVPVCIGARAQHMAGIGEVLVPLPGFPSLAAVLVNPRIGVSTASVFHALGLEKGTMRRDDIAPEVPELRFLDDVLGYCEAHGNDMQAAAMALCPIIGKCISAVNDTGAALARMSGSGATVFGLYRSVAEAEAAAERLVKAHPDWWVTATILR
jgi:4-diphosphocytidyl-2-C-methyl-D-erythritol kinase